MVGGGESSRGARGLPQPVIGMRRFTEECTVRETRSDNVNKSGRTGSRAAVAATAAATAATMMMTVTIELEG
jgi:hypothetical protein